ncbi:MAG: FAD-dependent oxidoreductase, partial [Myxococcota bacterium]
MSGTAAPTMASGWLRPNGMLGSGEVLVQGDIVMTKNADLIVVGAGISGMSLALYAAKSGLRVLVIEREANIGGCLASRRHANGYWYELGAHTAYNSYAGFIDMIKCSGLKENILARAKVPFRILREGRIRSIAQELNWLEAALSLPRGLFSKKEGASVADYYGRLVGRRNYAHVLGHFLAAVPSQCADDFPATMLFKERPRRKDFLRSYTLNGGLASVPEALASHPGVTVRTSSDVTELAGSSHGFAVHT